MEGVVVSAVTGAMATLLPKLAALLANKYKLSRGVHKQIASLKNEMSSMNAHLVKLSRMEELDEQQKDWRDKVRELSYDMEDCIDTFTHDLDGGGDGKPGLEHILKEIKARYNIANRIKELKARAVEISDCRNRYTIDEHICPPRGLVAIDPRIEALYAEANSFVGIDGPKEKLIGLLNKVEDANRLKVVTVVGYGGMGKTTLTKQVYAQIKSQFDCKAFVTVSQNPNMVKTLKEIFQGLGGSSWDYLNDECKLIDALREHLKDKRYLIVIDDIWTMKAWNTIKISFVENNLGSRVITTTRIEDVAKECCSRIDGHVYRIKPLNDLDSRRLFYRRIFHFEDACPEQLKNVSDEILKKCDGVPLAILSVASCLASHEEVNSKETWEKIQNYLGYQMERHPALEWMRHVLNIGYSDLSP